MTTRSVPPERVAHALRGVRPNAYRIGDVDGVTTLALVMAASEAGRRNAAERLVRALAAAGLEPAAPDPVATFTARRDGIVIAEAGEPESA